MQEEIKRLEKLRNLFRTLMMACLMIELAAVVLIFAGQQVIGMAVGIASMAGYFYTKSTGKRRFGEACGKVQAEKTLGLKDVAFEGRMPFDGAVLHSAGLISSALKIDSTMMRNSLRGSYEGKNAAMGEITFGVVYPGQNRHEFNAGVLLTAEAPTLGAKPVLLMGHNSVRHKLIRKEYEDDGWKLCPVGGKNKGWYVFTPDGVAPEEQLLNRLDELSRQAEGMVLLSLKEGKMTAFFLGHFYTGEYKLGDPAEEKDLREKLFHHVPAAMQLAE